MKFTILNTGILALLFAMPVAHGSDLQLPGEANGKIAFAPALSIGERQDPAFLDTGMRAWPIDPDSYQGYRSAANGLRLASASPDARYQDECSQCHGDADEFVRESLAVRNGALIGQYSEKPLAEFLKTHQKLKPADVKFYADLLSRVAGEIGLQ